MYQSQRGGLYLYAYLIIEAVFRKLAENDKYSYVIHHGCSGLKFIIQIWVKPQAYFNIPNNYALEGK